MRKKVQQIATFTIQKKHTSQTCSSFQLVLSKGSILDFQHPNGAIVNAANEGCLGGGGVDGAISDAGGRQLLQDRIALPKIQSKTGDCIRCLTGDAVITGPNQYGTIGTPYVIHAVGPAYYMYDDFDEPDVLLSKAYGNAMQRAKEAQVEAVGFSGVFRGSRSRVGVLRLGIEAICCFDVHPELAEVHLFAFTQMEVDALLRAAELMKLTQDECMIR